MSFFGRGNPFGMGEDPFFGDIHRHMHEMDRMMNGIMGGGDPFGGFMGGIGGPQDMLRAPRQQMIVDGGQRRHEEFGMMTPFGGGGGGMFGGLMGSMDAMRRHAELDPNSHMFSQSTTISFGGDFDRPRYYETTESIRKAGDAKEIRKTVRNSETGEDKMSIGHSLGDRHHLIEKKKYRNGKVTKDQHFVNMNQAEAEDFDREFSARVRRNYGVSGHSGDRYRSRAAIEDAQESEPIPIVSHPDDNLPEPSGSSRYGRRRRNNDGPIIEEI